MNFLTILLFSFALIQFSVSRKLPTNKSQTFKSISKSKECSEDIQHLCSHTKSNDDITLLNCLQDNEKVIKAVSKKCQHFLWEFKRSLTTSEFLDGMTKKNCQKDLQQIEECRSTDIGHKVPCLLDHKLEVKENMCRLFLNDIGVIIFSDYHMIFRFVERCRGEVKRLKCGRLSQMQQPARPSLKDDGDDTDSETEPEDMADYVTSQAQTLACLSMKTDNVSAKCRREIVHIAELQADDYHLNRALYLACRDDRDILCGDIAAGEGRVYQCLMKNKMSDKISEGCRRQLLYKQQVESVDVKADYTLFKNCKADLEAHNCMETDTSKNEYLRMSTALICLENVDRKASQPESEVKKLDPHCRTEINQRRTQMLEDYQVSPEMVVACQEDAVKQCKEAKNLKEPGEIVYCLMQLATPDDNHPHGRVLPKCRAAILHLLEIVNPTENLLQFDPAMTRACGSTLNALCNDAAAHTKDAAFSCLLRNMRTPEMTKECREKMTSLLFFISIDVTISDSISRSCHADAAKHCKAKGKDDNEESMIDKNLEYHCMYELYKKDRIALDMAEAQGQTSPVKRSLSSECANEMFELIKAQANKVELDPIVFEPCIDDLAKYCSGSNHKERRHECLQDNIQNLKASCKKAVIEFSQMQDADVRLSSMMVQACEPVAHALCASSMQKGVDGANSGADMNTATLQCLERHKFSEHMTEQCRASVEHLQIISMQEYSIDHRFARYCSDDIQKLCSEVLSSQKSTNKDGQKESRQTISKADIVGCLSKAVLETFLSSGSSPLSKQCQAQFSYQLLQRSDSVKLDPRLANKCDSDIRKFCTQVPSSEISACLREHQDELDNVCHKMLFRREQLESVDDTFDGRLARVCGFMIRQLCQEDEPAFECLHRNLIRFERGQQLGKIEGSQFDESCRKLMLGRLSRRMNDVRLNPGIMSDCKEDIAKYCNIPDITKMEPEKGVELNGIIIRCLKVQHVNNTRSLKPRCRIRISQIIVEANMFLRLDPVLRKACSKDIPTFCQKEVNAINKPGTVEEHAGRVQNCLKHKYLRRQELTTECQQEVFRLLRESQSDIHTDMELFDDCEDSIIRLCHSEEFGSGRKVNCLMQHFNEETKNSKDGKSEKGGSGLDEKCRNILTDRRELWAAVGSRLSGVDSLKQVYEHVSRSDHKTYLLAMMGLLVFGLVTLGICCGRATKRIAVDLKNK